MSRMDPSLLTEMPDPAWNDFLASRFGRSLDGYKEVCCFDAACRIGLFDVLTEPKTAEQVSRELGTVPVLTGPFLEVLTDMDVLVRDGDTYVCGKAAALYMVKSSPYYLSRQMGSTLSRLSRWNDIGDNIMNIWKDGTHKIDYDPWITGIAESAAAGEIQSTLAAIKRNADLSGCRTLMDLGGGHGLYSVAFTHEFPGLHCTVFDQPQVTPITRRYADLYGTDIGIQEGDYYKDSFEGMFDVFFASYNNACNDPELVRKVASSINPGGYLIIKHSVNWDIRPLDFIEWNNRPPADPWKRRDFADYVAAAEESGLHKAASEEMNYKVELVVFRKDGTGQ